MELKLKPKWERVKRFKRAKMIAIIEKYLIITFDALNLLSRIKYINSSVACIKSIDKFD